MPDDRRPVFKTTFLRDLSALVLATVLVGGGVFLWFGGPGLLVLGCAATLGWMSRLSGNSAVSRKGYHVLPSNDVASLADFVSSRSEEDPSIQPRDRTSDWRLLIAAAAALVLVGLGLFLFDVPGPLS